MHYPNCTNVFARLDKLQTMHNTNPSNRYRITGDEVMRTVDTSQVGALAAFTLRSRLTVDLLSTGNTDTGLHWNSRTT